MPKFTRSEREYIQTLVNNLSFQRLSDPEIIQWLHDQKQIDLDRSTIYRMRNSVQKEAKKWYIELRNSSYKYIATYKERLDSLLSYQKRLWEIIATNKKDEVKIRAIAELHSIEMDIFSLWKQLPNLNTQSETKTEESESDSINSNSNSSAVLELQQYLKGFSKAPLDMPSWIQCGSCKMWFKNQAFLTDHTCDPYFNDRHSTLKDVVDGNGCHRYVNNPDYCDCLDNNNNNEIESVEWTLHE